MEQSGGSKENKDENITRNIKTKIKSGRSTPSRNHPAKMPVSHKTSFGVSKRRKVPSLASKDKVKSKTIVKKTISSKRKSVKSKAVTPIPCTSRSSIKHEFGVRKMSNPKNYPKFKIKAPGAKKKPVNYKPSERREPELKTPHHEKKASLTSRASFQVSNNADISSKSIMNEGTPMNISSIPQSQKDDDSFLENLYTDNFFGGIRTVSD